MKTKECMRCGQLFDPEETKRALKILTREPRFCETCMVRNLTDGLDLPMPPELLDKHSKHPTLTDREYREKLNAVKPEEDETK